MKRDARIKMNLAHNMLCVSITNTTLPKVQSIQMDISQEALGDELVLTKASLQKITSLEQTQQIINTQLFLHNVFADKSSPKIFSHRFNAPSPVVALSKPEIILIVDCLRKSQLPL